MTSLLFRQMPWESFDYACKLYLIVSETAHLSDSNHSQVYGQLVLLNT